MAQGGVPVDTLKVEDLESVINKRPNGKSVNPPMKLVECELMRQVQYKCYVEEDKVTKRKFSKCYPFERLFRQ